MIPIASLGEHSIAFVEDEIEGVPDHSGEDDHNGGDAIDVEKRHVGDGGQDTAVNGPTERNTGEHGGEEQREAVLVARIVHHEREEDAQRDHERGQQAVDDEVAGLARHPTLHGDRRMRARALQLLVGEVERRLRQVVLHHVDFDVHVVVQLPDVLVQRRRLGHLGRYAVVLHDYDFVQGPMRRQRDAQILPQIRTLMKPIHYFIMAINLLP